MRYVLAIVALAISGVLLLLGIGQRTFLAGPSEIVYPIAAETDAPYAVLDVSELTKVEGQANVVMRGNAAFSALANTRDADAWLEPFDHVELTVDPATKAIVSSPVAGKAPTGDALAVDDEGNAVPIDPRGSDLWLQERSGEEGVSRMAVEPGGEQSIIISGSGAEPIPKGTALVWVQDRATPWAGPLLAAGGLFAVIGAVLYLIAFDRDKRALGPRRGRSGPLLGVRNVFTGSGKRGKGEVEAAPRRGSNDNAPELAAGAAAGAVAAGGADAESPDAEEVVTAEVVAEDQDQDQDPAPDDVADAEDASDEVVAEVLDAEVVDADVPDAEAVDAEAVAVEAVDVDAVDADADATDTDATDADATEAEDESAPATDADRVGEDDAAKKGDTDAE
ncbi:hypothetical protein [Leucobacter aridicollis]|uniref:Uncharacterized protein n=1 Tax=Leucobacter aridicollis TaxID=283878 RepID=A0A852RE72_9MICO|nr:hypothetical protein [Leucobacter aridicollis]NYD27160.1 hypothetical protein [Leucobacter aridicollis]